MEKSVTISKTNASEALSTVSKKSVLFLFLHYAIKYIFKALQLYAHSSSTFAITSKSSPHFLKGTRAYVFCIPWFSWMHD